MLRDFVYNPTATQLTDILKQFKTDVLPNKLQFAVLKFEVITPDSYMWRLLVNGSVYYLYAEDYIPSLEYVTNVFNSYLESDAWEFLGPSGVKSGYDSVFLVRSTEKDDNALFSADAPRGFVG